MKTIITIGRHFGSGGKEVGKKLSEQLGIPFYDEEIVNITARAADMDPDVIKQIDEKATKSLLYSLITGGGLRGVSDAMQYEMPINDKLFIKQSKVIKELAEKGSGVFVGRCADYVLEDEKDILRVFIYADMDWKIERVSRLYNLEPGKAKEKIVREEKTRKTYYNYYTDKTWGALASYDLAINTACIGVDGAVDIIKNYIEKR